MGNSKLTDLLRTFSLRELRAFRVFAESPYFNRNADLLRLLDWMAPRLALPEPLERAAVFGHLFPGEPLDDRRLNHLMSALLKLAEQFLAVEHFQNDGFQLAFATLESLSERKLEKNYRFLFEKTLRDLEDGPHRDTHYLYRRYRLEDLEREHFARQEIRRPNESVQRAADHLDYFYLSEKLKYTCAMLNSSRFLAVNFNLIFVDEVRRFAEHFPLPPEAAGVRIYACILRLLTQPEADDDFENLKNLLREHRERFDRPEMAILYQYAINYCVIQIQKARARYQEEALELYREAVGTGILLENGHLSPWHFKNMIKLGLNLRQYAWTEQFIREKSALLEAQFRDDALNFNLADLYFHTGRKAEAMALLNKVEFSDIHYSLGAKVMLAKIYFDDDALDVLESLLHAFRTFLRRNKIVSDSVRTTYLNFIDLLRQIMRITPDRYPALREKVGQTDLLTEKNWLLAKLAH